MADPYRAVLPEITIDTVDFKCHARKLSLLPDQKFEDVSTFCNPGGQIPTTATWKCTLEMLQSFGINGAWNQLRALSGTLQTIVVYPGAGTTAAVTNPEATFDAWIPSIPFLDATPGSTMTYTLELQVEGEPVFATS